MIKKQSWKVIAGGLFAGAAILAVGAAVFTVQAWARPMPRGGALHGPGDGPGDGPGGFGVVHFGPLVEQLIFPCRNDCVQAEHTCHDTAESAALTCATQTCASTITSAQTDCAADRSSQACLTDVSTLITCVQPCVTTEAAAVKTCGATYKTCIGSCSPTPTPTP